MNKERLMLASMLSAITIMVGCAQISPDKTSMGEANFRDWPKDCSPQEIGKRVAERFVASPHPNFGRTNPPNSITYPETCAWYGALTFAKLSGDKTLTAKLIQRSPALRVVPNKSNPTTPHFLPANRQA